MPGSEAPHRADRPRFAPFLIVAVSLLAFFGAAAAELAAFLTTALKPAADDLDLASAWAARPENWWWAPMVATVIAAWSPRFPTSPMELLRRARTGSEIAGGVAFGVIAWCAAASLLLSWLVFGSNGVTAATMFGIAVALIVALLAARRFTRSGLPDWSSTLFVAVILGAAMGAFMPSPPRAFDCKEDAALRLRSGDEFACRSVDWFKNRKAVLVRRADGSTKLVAKTAMDPAALLRVLGTDVVLLDPAPFKN